MPMSPLCQLPKRGWAHPRTWTLKGVIRSAFKQVGHTERNDTKETQHLLEINAATSNETRQLVLDGGFSFLSQFLAMSLVHLHIMQCVPALFILLLRKMLIAPPCECTLRACAKYSRRMRGIGGEPLLHENSTF